MIIPPPDIRLIIHKTAKFVAKSTLLEEKIREKEKHNAKFCFLNPADPYFAYYQHRLQQVKAGTVTDDLEESLPTNDIKEPEKPNDWQFENKRPILSAQDCEIIKLTALFVAKKGRQFMIELAQKENKNRQFDFMKSNHSLFAFFSKYVEHFVKVLKPNEALVEEMKMDRHVRLEKLRAHADYDAYQSDKRMREKEDAEKERKEFAAIDWHDFCVVETIEFGPQDEVLELPPPMTLMQLESMSLAQKSRKMMFEAPEEMEMEMEVEEESADQIQETNLIVNVQEFQETVTHKELGPIKVKKDYVPKLKTADSKPNVSFVGELDGKKFALDETQERIRVDLLDPKWKEQKDRYEERQKGTNLNESQVSHNLKQFSQHRNDIFGGSSLKRKSEDVIVEHVQPVVETLRTEISDFMEDVKSAGMAIEAMTDSHQKKQTEAPPPPPVLSEQTEAPPSAIEIEPTSATTKEYVETPEIKRRRLGLVFIPEEEYYENVNSNPIDVTIFPSGFTPGLNIPTDPVLFQNLDMKSTIGDLKQKVADAFNLPPGRQKLSIPHPDKAGMIVTKNQMTLGFYNIKHNALIELRLKERGGKK